MYLWEEPLPCIVNKMDLSKSNIGAGSPRSYWHMKHDIYLWWPNFGDADDGGDQSMLNQIEAGLGQWTWDWAP